MLGTTAGAPTKDRAHAAVLVTYDDGEKTSFLFDCGEGTQRQLMRLGVNPLDIDAIFITHWHGDHCLGLAGLIDTMGFDGRERPLYVYSPEPRRLGRFLKVTRSIPKFAVRSVNAPARGRHPGTILECKRFKVASVPVVHSVPAVAYALIEKDKMRIDVSRAAALGLPERGPVYQELKENGAAVFEGKKVSLNEVAVRQDGKKIVYSGDTVVCAALRELVKGADLLVQDCTYLEDMGPRKPYPHASFPEVSSMVLEEGVKRTVLTHFSRRYPDIRDIRSRIGDPPGIEPCEDFYSVTV